MVESNPFRVSTRLLFNFAKYKRFEELTEQLALVIEFGGWTLRAWGNCSNRPLQSEGC